MHTVFVDLDETLISRTSSRIELVELLKEIGFLKSAIKIIKVKPKSRAAIKIELTKLQPDINYTKYYESGVIQLLLHLKSDGVKIIVATGAMESTAKNVISEYPVQIDEIISSSIDYRNKGIKKLKSINDWLKRNNQEGFIYIGDAVIDFSIMKKAQRSYLVGGYMKYLIGKHLLSIKNLSYIKRDNGK